MRVKGIEQAGLKKEELKAVYEGELFTLLENIDELQAVRLGKRRCKFCDDVITASNLQAIFPESGSVKFACSSAHCTKDLMLCASQLRSK